MSLGLYSVLISKLIFDPFSGPAIKQSFYAKRNERVNYMIPFDLQKIFFTD
jgi:hypothetical protein